MKRLSRYLSEVQEFDASVKRLNELFIKASEINSMPQGRVRDMQMVRLAIIAEFDAANLYEMMADLSSAPQLKKLFMEISNEEKVHIGELEFALEKVDPEHDHFEDKGEDEAEELTGWNDDENEEGEEVEEGKKGNALTEDASARKQKTKASAKASQMRCKAIAEQIHRRREGIRGLLLQGRQWGCNE